MSEVPLDVMGRKGAGEEWGHSHPLGHLVGGWRWEAVGWEVTSGCWLLIEEHICLQGPEMKQNLCHQCNVLSPQVSLGP